MTVFAQWRAREWAQCASCRAGLISFGLPVVTSHVVFRQYRNLCGKKFQLLHSSLSLPCIGHIRESRAENCHFSSSNDGRNWAGSLLHFPTGLLGSSDHTS
jgi:hypothetical protein